MAARMDEDILLAVAVRQFDAFDQIDFGIVAPTFAADAGTDGQMGSMPVRHRGLTLPRRG
jgi:hypothetical protein